MGQKKEREREGREKGKWMRGMAGGDDAGRWVWWKGHGPERYDPLDSSRVLACLVSANNISLF